MKFSKFNMLSVAIMMVIPVFMYACKPNTVVSTSENNAVEKTTSMSAKSDSGKAYKIKGIQKNEQKDYAGSVEAFNKAIQFYPNDLSIYFYRGDSKYNLQDYKGAVEDFSRAIELEPGNGIHYNHKGMAETKLGNYQEALKDFNKALELVPGDAEFYYYRGILKLEMKDKKGACPDLIKASELGYDEANDLVLKNCK